MNLQTIATFQNEPIVNPWNDDAMKRELLRGIETATSILKSPHKLLIGESWVDGETSFTTVNPNNRAEAYGPFPVASESQATKALEWAKIFFSAWSQRSQRERSELMRQLRQRFVEEKWTLMGLLMKEVGKTALEAYAEWAEAVDFLAYYADVGELLHDDAFHAVSPMQGHRNRLLAKPLGIGASLPPFNFPCAILTGMWAAPTVVGNVIVVKPSPRAPATGIFCAKLFQEVGLPVQLILDGGGAGHAIGQLLVEHPDVALITFTGSHAAGMAINRSAAQSSGRWIKRVVAEMGGCDFIAVHDFDDIVKVIDAVQDSAIGFQGQKCSALSRLIVKEDLYDNVKNAVHERLARVQLKDVLEPASLFGGVIDERAFQTISGQCQQIQKAGAQFFIGGRADANYPGFGIPVSVHEGLRPESAEASMEVFGPVFGLYKAKNFDDMVRVANATPYALTGAFFTTDQKLKVRAHEFTSGNTYINRKCTGAMVGAQPFGGWYGSGTDDKAGHWSHLLRFIQWQTISERV